MDFLISYNNTLTFLMACPSGPAFFGLAHRSVPSFLGTEPSACLTHPPPKKAGGFWPPAVTINI